MRFNIPDKCTIERPAAVCVEDVMADLRLLFSRR
jgi:hypothetical protein